MMLDTTSVLVACCGTVLFLCFLHKIVRNDNFLDLLSSNDEESTIANRIFRGHRRRFRQREMRRTMRRLCMRTQTGLLVVGLVGIVYLVNHVVSLTHKSGQTGWWNAGEAAISGGLRRFRLPKRQGNYTTSSWETAVPHSIPWTVIAVLVIFAAVVVTLGRIYMFNQHHAVVQGNRNEFRGSLIAAIVALITALLAA